MASSSAMADDTNHHSTPHVDLCSNDDQCLNGGSCQEGNTIIPHRHCQCATGFSGPACQRFCPLDCQNGGYCQVAPTGGATGLLIDEGRVFDPEDYSCKCFGYFTGILCEIPYKRCGDSERCYNGGECVAGDDMQHHCKCARGYTGVSCETRTSTIVVVDDDSTIEGILLAMVVLLSIALFYLLKRKRTKLTPDFVQVQRSALQHKMAAMPHASFDDESSVIHFNAELPALGQAKLFDDEEAESDIYAMSRVGPFSDDESSTTSGSSRFGGIHII